MPGVGKSSCAVEYARYYRTEKDTTAVVRSFKASSEADIYAQYLALAKEYGISDRSDKISVISTVHNKLHKQGDNIIFIFDNVDKYENIKQYIENAPNNVKIIITLRDNNIVKNLGVNPEYHYPIQPFTNTESIKYLKQALAYRVSTNQTSEQELQALSEELGNSKDCLPYKLKQAVAWLNNKELSSIEDYIELHKLGEEDGHETKLLLDLLNHSENAWQILQYTAYLDPDFIDIDIFTNIFSMDRDSLNADIKILKELSLVDVVRKPNMTGIKLHRLTQDMIPKYIDRHNGDKESTHLDKKDLIEKLHETLNKLMPFVDHNPDQRWENAGAFYQHSIKLIDFLLDNNDEQYEYDKTDSNLISLLDKLGMYDLYITHHYMQSIKYSKKALEMQRELLHGKKNTEIASLLNKDRKRAV